MVDEQFRVHAKGAAYYALRLITQDWALPGDRPHGVYPVTTSLGDSKPLVTAYALKRPDDMWSVLVVNKDSVARTFTIGFDGPRGRRHFTGMVNIATFGHDQFDWGGNGPADTPAPDLGIVHTAELSAGGAQRFVVAPQTLTVLRGTLSP
jgi:hypothetical protein